ncbi:hypothetical protein L2E82_20342 [Cichorium intybus]|uniref:Uncharacterized protein n=1 Tax=Cichorium intybus TaxID=13427 RepID=A0ACB9DU29_CICIN|nr:hypothetical protein L2E82_20342 [Cichorium intybus]
MTSKRVKTDKSDSATSEDSINETSSTSYSDRGNEKPDFGVLPILVQTISLKGLQYKTLTIENRINPGQKGDCGSVDLEPFLVQNCCNLYC